jgi:NAD dependent epimerase/dehydratase
MNKTVLVTGSDGFIGSHLVEHLVDNGYSVRAFVFYNSLNNWGWIDSFSEELKSKIDIFAGDIRDPNGVRTAMEGIDTVFHLAALIAIPFSYHSPDSYVDTNIKGTLNVLQAARLLKTRRVLVTSTSEVYGTAQYVPIDEKHPFQGQSPYSASKIGADRLAESFYRSFDLPVTIVRPFNTYGPRQSARAIIPTIITQLLNGKKELDLGDLTPTRDLVFVRDTVKGFRIIAESDRTIGEEINIATQDEISMGDLAQTLIDLINPGAIVKMDTQRLRPDKSEVRRLLGNNQKLKELIGWSPQTSLKEGLALTVPWFSEKENLSFYKAGIYNV